MDGRAGVFDRRGTRGVAPPESPRRLDLLNLRAFRRDFRGHDGICAARAADPRFAARGVDRRRRLQLHIHRRIHRSDNPRLAPIP